MIRSILVVTVSLGLAMLTPRGAAADPAVPIGLDPGGIAVGLVFSGLDYTDPEIAKRLARDGEGHPIAWDAVGEDPNPFERQAGAGPADGTAVAKSLLAAYRNARLVAVRADSADPRSLAAALGFAMRTPARLIAVTSLGGPDAASIVAKAAEHAAHILFFVPADASLQTVPANVVRVAPVAMVGRMGDVSVDAWVSEPGRSLFGDLAGKGAGDDAAGRALAVARAAGNAACAQHGGEAASAADARAKFLALAKPSQERPGLMVHDPLCWYGGVVNGR